MKLDAHQHFWQYDPIEYDWIDDNMQAIAKDFLPSNLAPQLHNNNMDGCIAVQARQSEEETNFLIELADKHPVIKGVVGWVDLRDENIEERLNHYAKFKAVKGFRHVLQGEPDLDFMLQPAFLRGITALKIHNFVYDILIFPKQLPNACKLVALFPEQTFVLDHIAKPDINNGDTATWEKDIKALSAYPNVYCKISGMVTEADWSKPEPEVFTKYIHHVLECFGTKRVMFGSDWPVCQVAASYDRVVAIVEHNTRHLSEVEKKMLWGETCAQVYKV
jgi:L-fuconolactonase